MKNQGAEPWRSFPRRTTLWTWKPSRFRLACPSNWTQRPRRPWTLSGWTAKDDRPLEERYREARDHFFNMDDNTSDCVKLYQKLEEEYNGEAERYKRDEIAYEEKDAELIRDAFESKNRAEPLYLLAQTRFYWCRRRDSNPYAKYLARDFKSLVSAIPPLRREVGVL